MRKFLANKTSSPRSPEGQREFLLELADALREKTNFPRNVELPPPLPPKLKRRTDTSKFEVSGESAAALPSASNSRRKEHATSHPRPPKPRPYRPLLSTESEGDLERARDYEIPDRSTIVVNPCERSRSVREVYNGTTTTTEKRRQSVDVHTRQNKSANSSETCTITSPVKSPPQVMSTSKETKDHRLSGKPHVKTLRTHWRSQSESEMYTSLRIETKDKDSEYQSLHQASAGVYTSLTPATMDQDLLYTRPSKDEDTHIYDDIKDLALYEQVYELVDSSSGPLEDEDDLYSTIN